MKVNQFINAKIAKLMEFSGSNHQSQSFILLINVKMPTIVNILTFMSRINFMLSLVEHEKSFTSSRQTLLH